MAKTLFMDYIFTTLQTVLNVCMHEILLLESNRSKRLYTRSPETKSVKSRILHGPIYDIDRLHRLRSASYPYRAGKLT